MSDELNQELETAAPAAEAQPKAKRAKREDKDDGFPKFMRAVKGFGYTDPETGLRFNPVTPIKVDVAPREGSWLDCQIKAGLIADA